MPNDSVAFVFPGQGSQKVGMLASAYAEFEIVRDTFAEASDVLDFNIWDLIAHGSQEDLNLTETTQPVLLASSVALWRAWVAQGGCQPAVMAGHSLGEFSALVCAGSLDFADAVSLVRQRGVFMQAAVPVGVGAMAAIIGLDDEAINQVCDTISTTSDGVVAAVNFNSPGQVVIAGHVETVERAIIALKEAGAKRALPLPVSAPFHTQLMEPAAQKLAEVISGITLVSPIIPVVHNVHAQTESNPEKIASLLVKQISSPVQWTRCIEAISSQGVSQIVECGPGKVLSGLNRRIDKALSSFSIEAPESLASTLAELTE